MLLLTSLLWGLAFVAQTDAAKYISPFTFQATRTFLGALTLTPLLFITKANLKDLKTLKAGIIIGIIFFFAANIQQMGVPQTTVAKAGFLTSLYIIIVPFIEFVIFKNKIGLKTLLCVILSTTGLFFLFKMNLSFNEGDILVLLAAILFAVHVIAINRFNEYNPIAISFIQFVVACILSAIVSIIFEKPTLESILSARQSIMYAGIISCGVAYTLQIIGQQKVNSTLSAICLSMESFFAAVFGFILLKQSLSFQEIIGCALMLTSIIISQINNK